MKMEKGEKRGARMAFLRRKSPLEREWMRLEKKETVYLKKHIENKNILNVKLEEKVPAKLRDTLNAAFCKAFALIFEKGTDIIEKSYAVEQKKKTYQINEYSDELNKNLKSLRAFRKEAASVGTGNILLSGAAGIGMGLAGVGIPDIPVFTALLLKNIYEISLSYGFDYRQPQEQSFILLLIEAALSHGEELQQMDRQLNSIIEANNFPQMDQSVQIQRTADCLSRELLYMKFLQGIPLVGAVGGAWDAVVMKQVGEYARLKYQRRLLLRKRKQN